MCRGRASTSHGSERDRQMQTGSLLIGVREQKTKPNHAPPTQIYGKLVCICLAVAIAPVLALADKQRKENLEE